MMLITTKYGEMDEALLTKSEWTLDGTVWVVEYFLGEELVHRSAVIRLSGLQAEGVAKI